MIINSMADAQVTSNNLIEFTPRPIAYTVSGSKSTISGTVDAGSFQQVDATATGSGPYRVLLGYVNESIQALPVLVDENESLVTFWMAFPSGPNGPQTFIYKKG